MAEGEKDKDTAFFNAQDGVRGRNGGPYADVEDARQAEKRRARAEGREPDLDNPPPFVGNAVVTGNFVEDNVFSNPSMLVTPNLLAEGVAKLKEDAVNEAGGEAGIAPVTLAVDTRTVLPDSERKAQQEAVNAAGADPASPAAGGGVSVSSDDDSAKKLKATSDDKTSAGGSNTASAQKSTVANKSATSKSSAAKRTAAKR